MTISYPRGGETTTNNYLAGQGTRRRQAVAMTESAGIYKGRQIHVIRRLANIKSLKS